MTPDVVIISLLIGAFAGVLAGFFGIGGGIIIVPALISLYSYQNYQSPYLVHTAMATSLFTVIFTTMASGYKHSKNNNVVWKAAVILGLTSSLSVFFFTKVAVATDGELLKKAFAFILIIIAVKMLFEKSKADTSEELKSEVTFNYWICGLLGIIAGIISAFSGLAGGVFLIPLMKYILKFPIKKAIGTSSVAILMTAVSAIIGYVVNTPGDFLAGKYNIGMVDTAAALPIIIGSIPLSQLGVMLNKKVNNSLLTRLFAVFVLLISLRMIFF